MGIRARPRSWRPLLVFLHITQATDTHAKSLRGIELFTRHRKMCLCLMGRVAFRAFTHSNSSAQRHSWCLCDHLFMERKCRRRSNVAIVHHTINTMGFSHYSYFVCVCVCLLSFNLQNIQLAYTHAHHTLMLYACPRAE